MPGDNKTQIVVAALGLVGVLGGALFANWDKISGNPGRVGPTKTEPPVPPPKTESPVPSPPVSVQPLCPKSTAQTSSQTVSTSDEDAKVVSGDSEVDSDDWTRVEVAYTLALSPSGKSLELHIEWFVQELNKNKSFGDTRILSRRKVTLYSVDQKCTDSRILSFSAKDGKLSNDFRGKVHSLSPFPDVGVLRNVRVRFDGPGRDDVRQQRLTAEVAPITMVLSATQ
jgi:hypothetical protein